MRKRIVIIELIDRGGEPPWLDCELTEQAIREIFDRMGRELPDSVGYKIRSID